jgi:hypothetical protein
MAKQTEERVYTFAFSEALERLYTLFVLAGDVIADFLREFPPEARAMGKDALDRLREIYRALDLSWIDDVNADAHRRKDEDLILYPAA